MTDLDDFWNNPHDQKPWKFPEEGVRYEGTIRTNPHVAMRLDKNDKPEVTPEGRELWTLWLAVETADGLRGFRLQDNSLAKAFSGRASQRNLRRWASEWQKGGRLTIWWTRADDGTRQYRGRYDAPMDDTATT